MKPITKKILLITAIVFLLMLIALNIFFLYEGIDTAWYLIRAYPDNPDSMWTIDLALTMTVISSIVLGIAAVLLILCIVKLIKVCRNK